jgi:hypothetical protein
MPAALMQNHSAILLGMALAQERKCRAPTALKHKGKCPAYEGSDFWNDPHLWCGVDPVGERCWSKEPTADCELRIA